MLVQIGENSATVTPFGSLASAGDDYTRNARTNGYRPSAITLALRWVFNLFAAAAAAPNGSK
jgi:hypothetical protein